MRNKNIDNSAEFDFGRVSEDYARYRDIYPKEFYEKILDLGLCKDGQKILDIGTGTGVIPRNMYKYGGEFVGTDISVNQIKQAKILAEKNAMDIDFVVSSAENLDFPNKCFDVVTACQCYMYFNEKIVLPKMNKSSKNGQ